MSISTEIARLQQAKSDLAISIAAKGVTVPAATTLDGYAALVDQIQGGGRFPYGAEIEYLQCDGNQYINNFYTENASTQVLVVNIQYQGLGDLMGNTTSYQNGCKIVGVLDSGYPFVYYKPTGTRILIQDNYTSSSKVSLGAGFSKTSSKFSLTVDNRSAVTGNYSGLYSTVSHRLFSRNNSNASSHFNGKFYGIQIKEDNVLVRDCIPLRIGTTGYVYDKISGILFANNGSGSFTLGPDVT